MGIMDVFKPKAEAPVQQQQPAVTQQTNQPAQQSSGSPMIDAAKGGPAAPKPGENSSPMDPYTDLWKDEVKPADTGNSANNPQVPANKADPDFSAYAKKVDFSRTLNPELVQKALAGDGVAFGQVINSAVQAALAISLKSSHSMLGKREIAMRESIIGELPQHFKSLSVQNSGYKNPAFKHPAMKPLVDATKQQFLQKYPDATTSEIDDHVEKYLAATFEAAGFGKPGNIGGAVVETIDPNSHSGKIKAQREGEFDWGKEFGFEVPGS